MRNFDGVNNKKIIHDCFTVFLALKTIENGIDVRLPYGGGYV